MPVVESVVVEKIRKNKVSRALYLMQRALLEPKASQSCTRKLLEVRSKDCRGGLISHCRFTGSPDCHGPLCLNAE